MAIKDIYTLDDITSYADEKFPLAFDIIADPEVYRMKFHRFRSSTGHFFDGHFLHVGFWESEGSVCPVWVYSNGFGSIYYFIERSGQPLTSVGTNERILKKSLLGPFSYIPTRELSQTHQEDDERCMHASGNELFSLLIHVAFLVAGKIHRIRKTERVNLLEKIEHLCNHLYGNKVADLSVAVRQMRMNHKRVEEQVPNFDSQTSQSVPSSVVRGYKRNAEDDLPDHPAPKIRKHSGNILLHSKPPLRSAGIEKPSQPSMQLTSTFETLIRQCKAETEHSWVQEKDSFQQTISRLRSELVKERAKVQERESFQQTISSLRSELAKEQAKVQEAEKKADDLQKKSNYWQGKYRKFKERLAQLIGGDED